jgi:hypothetical protein
LRFINASSAHAPCAGKPVWLELLVCERQITYVFSGARDLMTGSFFLLWA